LQLKEAVAPYGEKVGVKAILKEEFMRRLDVADPMISLSGKS